MTLHGNGTAPANKKLPDISLWAPDGSRVRISEYYGRSNLVLLVIGANRLACLESLLEDIAADIASYRLENAEVLLVLEGETVEVGAARGRLDLPFPVLDDPSGEARRRLGFPGTASLMAAAVWVADRFGEVVYVWQDGQGQRSPSSEELLAWLSSIELECPE